MKTSNESGRSMVEMLGVIAIIGVISVGAITSMSYVDSYFRTSATLMDIEQIARDINDMYSWAADYSGLNMADLCKEKIVQNCVDGSKILNRWGGTMTVQSLEQFNHMKFSIVLTQVPQVACERLQDQAHDTLMSMYIRKADCGASENPVIFWSN